VHNQLLRICRGAHLMAAPSVQTLQLAHAFSSGLLRLPCASVHTPPSHSVTSAVALVVSAARTRHRTQDRARSGKGLELSCFSSPKLIALAGPHPELPIASLATRSPSPWNLRICLSVLSMPMHALPLASVALPLSDAEADRKS